MLWRILTLCVVSLLALASATPLGGRTLVVHDTTNNKVSADEIASSLTARGHSVEVQALKANPQLFDFGKRTYDNVVLIPGRTKGLGKELTARKLLDFLRAGGNIVALTTPSYSPGSLREAAGQLGIHIGARGVSLVDHFSAAGSDDKYVAQLSDNLFDTPQIVGFDAESIGRVVNSSAGFVSPEENNLVLPLIHAPKTAYAYNILSEDDEEVLSKPFALGSEAVLAAATQTRNNARFAWIGSTDLLLSSYGQKITEWAFQENNVLRISDVEHWDPRTGESEHIYRVSDPVSYCVTFEEWKNGQWGPYTSDDIQLEFRMLDPYYRLNLEESAEVPGRYCKSFQIPDRYGMFTFLLDYRRAGKTFIEDRKVVTIRHMANDEWPRSWTITNSYVYLSSAILVIVAWVVFVALYFGEVPSETETEKPAEKPAKTAKSTETSDKKKK